MRNKQSKAVAKSKDFRTNLFFFLVMISMMVLISIFFKPVSAESLALKDDVKLHDFWARATLGNSKVGAIYGSIDNNSLKDVVFVSASSDVSKRVELHNHIQDDNGVMRMREVEEVSIKADENFKFKPGSFHIMLFDLNEKLEIGQTHQLNLTTSDGVVYEVDFNVVDPLKKHEPHSHHEH